MSEMWEDENRVLEKPYTGTLGSRLEPYPDTIDLPVQVITQPVGCIPKVELIASNHPLYFEQESGINMERVTAFSKRLLYQH